MDHIDNSLMGIFPNSRSSHTKDHLLLGAFGHFISEKKDFFKKEKTIGHRMHKPLKYQHRTNSGMSKEDSYVIWSSWDVVNPALIIKNEQKICFSVFIR